MDMQQNFTNVLHQAVEHDSHLHLAAAVAVMHTALAALCWPFLELHSVEERL